MGAGSIYYAVLGFSSLYSCCFLISQNTDFYDSHNQRLYTNYFAFTLPSANLEWKVTFLLRLPEVFDFL